MILSPARKEVGKRLASLEVAYPSPIQALAVQEVLKRA